MSRVSSRPAPLFRGVNLGGWLVLERWMAPSLFAGLAARDETSFCAELGRDAAPRLRAHWDAWVTRDDLAWLADTGIDSVRIPFGHWILGPPYPYHPRYGAERHPYVEGGIDVLDRALDRARECGLRVVLDLHAAPGCQNGFDNGGITDVCEWHTREEYLAHSADVLGRIAARYRGHPALLAIELLNEPRWDVPTDVPRAHYARAGVRERAPRRAPLPVLRARGRRARPRGPPAEGGRRVAGRGRFDRARPRGADDRRRVEPRPRSRARRARRHRGGSGRLPPLRRGSRESGLEPLPLAQPHEHDLALVQALEA